MSKFVVDQVVYTKNGLKYYVDDVSDGFVFCTSPSGTESDFREDQIMSEEEYNATRGMNPPNGLNRRFTPLGGLNGESSFDDLRRSEAAIAMLDRVAPDFVSYIAFMTMCDLAIQMGTTHIVSLVRIDDCKKNFLDSNDKDLVIKTIASFIGATKQVLHGAVEGGDEMMKAVAAKAMLPHVQGMLIFKSRLALERSE